MSNERISRQINDSIKKLTKVRSNLPTNRIRVVVALERAIARLEADSKLAEHLVFKGGFVLFKVLMNPRFTRDIDAIALGIRKNELPSLIESALKKDIHDGLWFGDVIDPLPQRQSAISIMPHGQSLSWLVYPLEFIYSEKLEALVDRGSASSRAKDIYDMSMLFSKVQGGNKLFSAIQKTFKNRNTPLPTSFSKFAEELDTSILKGAWSSIQLLESPVSFDEIWNLFTNQLLILDGLS